AGKIPLPNLGAATGTHTDLAGDKIQNQGYRSDEGCYDPVNHLYATALTGDPFFAFYTILDTTLHDADATGATLPTIIGRVLINVFTSTAAAGLEACVFDTGVGGTNFMYFNNDGTATNPHGETNGIPVSDLIAMRTAALPLTNNLVVFAGALTGTVATPTT